METYIKALPTKQDISRLERSYIKEISDLHKDIGHRLEDIENTVEESATRISEHETILHEHTDQIQQMFYGPDDQENRS